MTQHVVTTSTGAKLTVKAADPDVAVYIAKQAGFSAVSAKPR